MKKLVCILFSIVFVNSFSQNIPIVKLNDSTQLKLVNLKIDVEITGNFVTTMYDMKFYNGLDRTLEGELAFPLAEGQTVSKFAMNINGKLRDAVVVEKELARAAYETTIRQNIDPALLEKTLGNNYKARVYPILPKSQKHIVITIEQELHSNDNLQTYIVPLAFVDALKEFSVNINVYGNKIAPIIKNNSFKDFSFTLNNSIHRASLQRKNFIPKSEIIIQLQNTILPTVLTNGNYFYLYQNLKPVTRFKKKPKRITILWDTSLSLKNRKLNLELKLLDAYFQYLKNVEVNFISFSNEIHKNKTVNISNGNWNGLKKLINSCVYDGGTSLKLFNKLKNNSNEILLFSDGLSNLGEPNFNTSKTVYAINSLVSAKHEQLHNIATKTGGNYINLLRLSNVDAIQLLKEETFQFLGIKQQNEIEEMYPKANTNIHNDFSITGKFKENTSIELLFGYRGKVSQNIKVPITSMQKTKIVKRLWAKQKLTFLNKNVKKNKSRIIAHALENHLITDYTSMLILDRIDDYVRYKIEPPLNEPELRKEFKERIADIEADKKDDNEDLLDRRKEHFKNYRDLLVWYDSSYAKKRIMLLKPKQSEVASNNTQKNVQTPEEIERRNTNPSSSSLDATIEAKIIKIDSLNSNLRTVSGTVISQEDGALPGVSVIIKGTNIRTETDFDGNFSINTSIGNILQFSFFGYDTAEKIIGTSNTMNITMNGAYHMEEVVITTFGIKKETNMTTSALKIVTQEVSGPNITTNDAKSVQVRGAGSVNTNATPLYIVDGKIVTSNPLQHFKTDEIENIEVLKNEVATSLYGSKGANGLIIVTTKKGLDDNYKAIEALNEKIEEQITLKAWNPETPYIKLLENEPNVKEAYKKYVIIRNQYANSPSFYIDVADFFEKKGNQQIALTVLTNLIEINLNNYELMKALAYKLEYFKKYDLAVLVYKKVLELRPEEPQSYRDLALAYEYIGAYQKSFDLLYKIYNGGLLEKDEEERFYGIESVAFVELNRLVHKYPNKLKLTKNQKKLFNKIPVDIRVVVDWNHNDTDLDLWIKEPTKEKAYYDNNLTKIGGRISEDLTEGYGPEEYMLKEAIKGNYQISVDYYSDNVQKISGPTFLKISLFTNYGKKNEIKKISVVRLDKEEDVLEIAKLKF